MGFLETVGSGFKVLVIGVEGNLAVLVVEEIGFLGCWGETGTGLGTGQGHPMIRWTRCIVTARHFDCIRLQHCCTLHL